MKKVIVSLVAVIATVGAFAQKGGSEGGPQNVIKVNPLGLIFGAANVAYERALNEKSSIVIAPSFGGFKLGGFKYSQFGLGAEYRFYLSKTKTAPEGFYAAPGLGFTTGKTKVEDFFGSGSEPEAKFTSFGGKVVIGNQWIFNSGFTIDLNGGISYQSFSYKDNENTLFTGLKGNGIFPSLAFSIGYAF
jgi:Protein of unknown function (DUF3575)